MFQRTLLSAVLITTSMAASSANNDPMPQSKSLAAGTHWVLPQTLELSSLTIAEGASIAAPDGHSLTLTVNGAETPIRPGTYTGKVALSVTRDILVPFTDFTPYRFRTAVFVDDGRYVREKSVPSATVVGSVSHSSAKDIAISSFGPDFNGVVVTGHSTYTISNARIDLTGNGGNDFAGYGAAIMSSGTAKVTVNHAQIKTHGVVRTAIFVGGQSTMTVNDSSIEVFNGTLPSDYQFSIVPGKMMEVPYGLGFTGNVRATNLMESGTVYYNNSHIKAQGWGALSSDGNGPTHMYASNSLIETTESGYGAYANGDAHDHFSHCTFNVVDAGLIIGGNGSGTFTDATVVNSQRFGVMMHQGTGGSVLTIDKKSVLNSKSTAIQIKGRGADVVVDDARLHPGNGTLLQTMENDDPILVAMMAGHPGNPFGGIAMPGPPAGTPTFTPDVHATFRNTSLTGDVIHAMTARGEMTVKLQNATLTGAITTATAAPASGKSPTRETFRTVGDVKNIFGPSTGKHGLSVSLDPQSRWIATQTSYLNELSLAPGAKLQAPDGRHLILRIDGAERTIKPGSYRGHIVLDVTRQ